MIKKLAFVACMTFALAACSSDSGNSSGTTGGSTTGSTTGNTTGATTGGTTGTTTGGTTGATTGGATTGGTTGGTTGSTTGNGGTTGNTTGGITPSGSTAGVWFGTTSFGEGIVVVDSSGRVNGFSSNGAGQYEAVFGNAGAAMDRFFHRDSDNPASATSFTIAGDVPSTTDAAQADSITYNLSVTNDGQQLDNNGGPGNFSLTFATGNDVGTIDASSIAGTWLARSSFEATGSDLVLSMSFSADGSFSGYTQFNTTPQIAITGTASTGSSQYLNVSLQWNGQQRDGVLYRDRTTSRLVLNTIGVDGENNRSFSAYLTRQ